MDKGDKMTKQEIIEWAGEEYGTEPEYLWARYPEFAVLRNPDGKWYGILMNVPKNKFGLESDEEVEVLNVKADMMLIDMLVKQPGFYRAYHMNKRRWISIFLDGSVSEAAIKDLLSDSYEMTRKKRKKRQQD